MPIISQAPSYNLKAVLKETGLTADTLRAWERRYGLPMPQRTPGGHRIYSEYDIETVKWLRARQAEGLRISQAVELWKEIIEKGRDPLLDYAPKGAAPGPDFAPAADIRVENLRRSWLEASLSFDEIKAEEALNQAFAIYPVETVCTAILQAGLNDIGEEWYLGKATPQQEHFASDLAIRRLETLIAATPRPTREQTVLIGCPPNEWHTFSVLLLNLILRRRGLEVVYLGANIPIEQLEETSAAIQPDLIVLAAQQLVTAATLRSAALALQAHKASLAYGGLIFNRIPKLRERIPAYFLGESVHGAVQPIERLLYAPAPLPTALEIDETYQEVARLYREKRLSIEIRLHENLKKFNLPSEYIDQANAFFGSELTAALELDDPAYLEADLEWIKGLLTGHHIPAERLNLYLAAYSRAIRIVMGEVGIPISDWLDSYILRTRQSVHEE